MRENDGKGKNETQGHLPRGHAKFSREVGTVSVFLRVGPHSPPIPPLV